MTAKRDLATFMYYVPEYQKLGVTTQAGALDRMRELGFSVNPNNRVVHNEAEIAAYIDEYTAQRDQLSYGIDGIVEKVNDLATENALGNTVKVPAGRLPTSSRRRNRRQLSGTLSGQSAGPGT